MVPFTNQYKIEFMAVTRAGNFTSTPYIINIKLPINTK